MGLTSVQAKQPNFHLWFEVLNFSDNIVTHFNRVLLMDLLTVWGAI